MFGIWYPVSTDYLQFHSWKSKPWYLHLLLFWSLCSIRWINWNQIHKLKSKMILSFLAFFIKENTARPRDTRFLVPEKNRAVQNRTSWGLYLCTKGNFFFKKQCISKAFGQNPRISRLLLCNTVYSVYILYTYTKVHH